MSDSVDRIGMGPKFRIPDSYGNQCADFYNLLFNPGYSGNDMLNFFFDGATGLPFITPDKSGRAFSYDSSRFVPPEQFDYNDIKKEIEKAAEAKRTDAKKLAEKSQNAEDALTKLTPKGKNGKTPEQIDEEAFNIAKSIYLDVTGCGTSDRDLNKQIKNITKDNVLEVLNKWDNNFKSLRGGQNLSAAILGDTGFEWNCFNGKSAEQVRIEPIQNAVKARAAELGIKEAGESFSTVLAAEFGATFSTDDDTIIAAFDKVQGEMNNKVQENEAKIEEAKTIRNAALIEQAQFLDLELPATLETDDEVAEFKGKITRAGCAFNDKINSEQGEAIDELDEKQKEYNTAKAEYDKAVKKQEAEYEKMKAEADEDRSIERRYNSDARLFKQRLKIAQLERQINEINNPTLAQRPIGAGYPGVTSPFQVPPGYGYAQPYRRSGIDPFEENSLQMNTLRYDMEKPWF